MMASIAIDMYSTIDLSTLYCVVAGGVAQLPSCPLLEPPNIFT